MAEIDITALVTKYIAARDMKAKQDAAHKKRMEPLELAMEKTEAAILDFFNTHNMDSAKCEAGTAYKTMKTSATVVDMDAFLDFVRREDAWHMLEKRCTKTAVVEYARDTKSLPPGINLNAMAAVNVRRSS